MSPDGSQFLVDSITGPFEIYNRGTNSPTLTLSQPKDTQTAEAKVKQGVFAEDCKLAVCGSADGRVLVYDLCKESPVAPSQILSYDQDAGKGPVQTVSVSRTHRNFVDSES